MASTINNFKAVSSAAGGQLIFSWDVSGITQSTVNSITLYMSTKAVEVNATIMSYIIPVTDASSGRLSTSYVVPGLANGTLYSSILEILTTESNSPYRATFDATVCVKPNATGSLAFNNTDLLITLQLPAASLDLINRGYDSIANMGASLIYNAGAGMRIYDFSTQFQSDLSNNVLQPTLRIDQSIIPGLINNSPIELTVSIHNSCGTSDLYPTVTTFAPNRPDAVDAPFVVSGLEYNRKKSTVGVYNYNNTASAIVLFNKSADWATSIPTSYTVYRADVSGGVVQTFNKIVNSNAVLQSDAYGNQTGYTSGFNYDASFNFLYTDSTVAVGNSYQYKVSGNNTGEGYQSNASGTVKIGTKATIANQMSTVGSNNTVSISNILVTTNGYDLSTNYIVDVSGNKSSIPLLNNTLTISGLTNGVSYNLIVYPITTNGGKTYIGSSTSVTGTPYTTPIAPIIQSVSVLDLSGINPLSEKVRIKWSPVTYFSTAVSYKLTRYCQDASNVFQVDYAQDLSGLWSTDGSFNTYNNAGLTNGKTYKYTLITMSSVNTGSGGSIAVQSLESDASNWVVPFAIPAAPTSLTLTTAPNNVITVTFPTSLTPGLPVNYKLFMYNDASHNSPVNGNGVDISYGTTQVSVANSALTFYAKVTTSVTNNYIGVSTGASPFVLAGQSVLETAPAISQNTLYFMPNQTITDASATTFTIQINNNGNTIDQLAIFSIPVDGNANFEYLVIQNGSIVTFSYTVSSFSHTTANFVETWIFTFNSKVAFLSFAASNESGNETYLNAVSGVFTPPV